MSAVILAVSVNNASVYVVSMQMRNMTFICPCELCMCEIYLCWWSCRCYLLNVLFVQQPLCRVAEISMMLLVAVVSHFVHASLVHARISST